MTSVLERLVAIIAPHHCFGCGVFDNVLCNGCVVSLDIFEASFCVLCVRPTNDWQVCGICRRTTALDRVWLGASYDGLVAEVIRAYKFDRVKAAHFPLAAIAARQLPYFSDEWVFVPVPTAPSRIRQRGYDQVALLAREIAVIKGCSVVDALGRLSEERQVGTARAARKQQAEKAFYIKNAGNLRKKKVILVDDVCTTGATLAAAATLLQQAGVATICAVAVAWQCPEATQYKKTV